MSVVCLAARSVHRGQSTCSNLGRPSELPCPGRAPASKTRRRSATCQAMDARATFSASRRGQGAALGLPFCSADQRAVAAGLYWLGTDRPSGGTSCSRRRRIFLHLTIISHGHGTAPHSGEGNRDGDWSVGCLRCITRRDLRPLRHVCLSVALYHRRSVSLNASPAVIAVNYHTTELPDFFRSLLLRLVNIK